MSYKQTVQTSKTYGEDVIGAFTIKYEYESTNGAMPPGFQARGQDGKGAWINIDVTTGESGTETANFGGGAKYDADLVKTVLDTIQKLSKTFDAK